MKRASGKAAHVPPSAACCCSLLLLVRPRLLMLKREELHPVVVLLPGQLLEAGAHCPGGRGQDRRAERGRRPLPLLRDRVESASRS